MESSDHYLGNATKELEEGTFEEAVEDGGCSVPVEDCGGISPDIDAVEVVETGGSTCEQNLSGIRGGIEESACLISSKVNHCDDEGELCEDEEGEEERGEGEGRGGNDRNGTNGGGEEREEGSGEEGEGGSSKDEERDVIERRCEGGGDGTTGGSKDRGGEGGSDTLEPAHEVSEPQKDPTKADIDRDVESSVVDPQGVFVSVGQEQEGGTDNREDSIKLGDDMTEMLEPSEDGMVADESGQMNVEQRQKTE